MNNIEAMVTIVDTETGHMFGKRFSSSPIRIGSSGRDHLRLRHTAVGPGHGEILFFGPRVALFRNRSWLRKSWVDGVRTKRGQSLTLGAQSIVIVGPFEISVVVRRRTADRDRARKVTPLALTRPPGWEGRWNLDLVAQPYLTFETFASQRLPNNGHGRDASVAQNSPGAVISAGRQKPRDGTDVRVRASIERHELLNHLVEPRSSDSRLDDLDGELSRIAASVARDFGQRGPTRR